jgi:NAD(P)-dependent dehydrogenase (short-subunit alcohol dehydrogenase family)
MAALGMLAGCKVLITGASSGIGKAAAIVMAKHGATVFGTGRNEDALKALLEQQTLCGYAVADLTVENECQRVVDNANQVMNGLTTVVNSAGVLQGGGMDVATLDNFKYNFVGNVQAIFEIMQHSIPYLKQTSSGYPSSIINISSVNGKQSFRGCATYCASKAAVDQLTRCASLDLAPFNIRVNSINPGVVETPLQRRGGMSDENYEAFLERSINVTHPLAAALGRVAQPEEVGELISFLASTNAAFITGECIAIDGGRQNLGAR